MLFFGPRDAFAPLLIRRLSVRRFFLVCRRVGRVMVVRGSGVRRQRDASGVDVLDVFFQQLMSFSHRFGIFARYFLGDFLPSVRALDARDDTTNGHVSLVRSSTFSHVSSSSLSHVSTPCISFVVSFVVPYAFASFAPCLSRLFRHFGQCGFEPFVVFRTARLFTRQSFDSCVFVHVRRRRFHPLVRIVRTWIFEVGFLARVVDDGLASSTSLGWVEHEHAVRLHLLVSHGSVSIRVPILARVFLRLFLSFPLLSFFHSLFFCIHVFVFFRPLLLRSCCSAVSSFPGRFDLVPFPISTPFFLLHLFRLVFLDISSFRSFPRTSTDPLVVASSRRPSHDDNDDDGGGGEGGGGIDLVIHPFTTRGVVRTGSPTTWIEGETRRKRKDIPLAQGKGNPRGGGRRRSRSKEGPLRDMGNTSLGRTETVPLHEG